MGFSIENFFEDLLTYTEEEGIEDGQRIYLIKRCIRDNYAYAKACGVVGDSLN